MIGLDIDIADAVTSAVEQAVDETFAMMASRPIVSVEVCRAQIDRDVANTDDSITVLISLDGELKGLIGIGLSRKAAIDWTRDLIDHEADGFDQTVVDAVGELGNIVVGGAKRRLSDFQLKMGLPSVVKTSWRAVAFTKGIHPIHMEFAFEDSSVDVLVALDRSA